MRKLVRLSEVLLGFLLACVTTVLLVMLRYMLRTPQSLESVLAGEARLYKWQYGYIYYKVAGPVDAPAIVLFHALSIGASGYEMRHLVKELSHDYQVYTPDLLGFGLSDHPCIDYTAELYVALYRDFLREVVQRPAVLLGSGLSCNYCVAVADSEPALCQQLILITPETIFAMPQRPKPLAQLAANQLSGFVLYALVTSRPLLRIMVNQSHSSGEGGMSEPHAEELRYKFAVAHQLRAQHVILALLSGKLDLEVVYRLPYLTLPVQMIWGERVASTLPGLPSIAAQISIETIDDSNIFPHEEQPKKVIASIQAYTKKQRNELQTALVNPTSSSLANDAREGSASVEGIGERNEQEPIGNELGTVVSSTEATARANQPAEAEIDRLEGVMAYCFKCKQKRTVQNARRTTTSGGRRAVEGICPVCGTRLFRFIAAQAD